MSPSWTSRSSVLADDRSSVVSSWSASAACTVSDTFSPLQKSSASATLPALLLTGSVRGQTGDLGGLAAAVDGAARRRARPVAARLRRLVDGLVRHLVRRVGGVGGLGRPTHLLHRLLT